MSKFNRKGYTTVLGRKPDDTIAPFPVKIGSSYDKRNRAAVRKLKRQKAQEFREYKIKLKEAKKRVPLAQRSKIKLTEMPERYL